MNLATRIADLAAAVATEIRSRITADHPGVAKAWVCFGYVGSQVVVRKAFNVHSVTRTAKGVYRVTFANAMPDANYCWQAFARNEGSASTLKFASARVRADLKTATYVDVICASQAGTLSDTTELNLTVWR